MIRRRMQKRFESDRMVDTNPLVREFKSLSALLNSLANRGVNLDGLEVEANCCIPGDEECAGFNYPCIDIANGDLSPMDTFLEDIDEYIADTVSISKKEDLGIPDFEDTVTVEITCRVQTENNSDLHNIKDAFIYEIVFPYDDEEERFDMEPYDEGFSLRVRDSKEGIERMIQARAATTEHRMRMLRRR